MARCSGRSAQAFGEQNRIADETTVNDKQAQEIQQLRSKLDRLHEQQARDLVLKKHGDFLSWLGHIDTRAVANAKLKARTGLEQNGTWIYDDPITKPWLSQGPAERPVLWLTADPRFGKSCLAVRIIQDLGGLDSQGVAWFFCTRSSVQEILQTWVHHLLALRDGKSQLEMPESFGDFQVNGDRSVAALCDMLRHLMAQKKLNLVDCRRPERVSCGIWRC